MLEALGTLIAIAVAMAISTIPFLATVVILLSPRRGGRAILYLLGYLVGLLLVVSAFTFGLAALPGSIKVGPSFGVVEIVVGLALMVLAVVQWRRQRRREPSKGVWFDRLERVGPIPALGFALALNLRPKALLLAAAAGIAISRERLDFGEALICIAVFVLIGSITVSAPIVMSIVMPKRTSAWLRSARAFIVRHSSVLTLVVLLMIGVFIIGDGITRL
ncbi:MAG TPA: GAP family protein [Microbacteriaceae bacterium]|nr:GAP family protein [Microbacteriaceae bacterium]